MEPLDQSGETADGDVSVDLQMLKQTLSEVKDVFEQRLRTKNAKYEKAQELKALLLIKRKDLKLIEEQTKKLEEIQPVELLDKKRELTEETQNVTDLEKELERLSSKCDVLQSCVRLECKFQDKENPTKVTAAYLMKHSPKYNTFMSVKCLPVGQPCGPAQLDMYWSWLEEIVEKEQRHEQHLEEQRETLSHEKRE